MKKSFRMGLVWLFLFVLALPVAAESSPVEDFFGAVGDLPPEVTEELPEGFLAGDGDSLSEAVQGAGGFVSLLRAIGRYVSLGLDGALSLFATLLGVIVLSAVFRMFRDAVTGEGTKQAVELASAAVAVLILLSVQGETLGAIEHFFEAITLLVGSMAPIMATLYAMGGSLQTAVVAEGGLMTFLALLEGVASGTLLPVSGVCTALAVCSAVSPHISLGGLLNLVKRCYTFFLGFLMLLLTFTLSLQTTLSAAADNVAMRGAKMLAGSAIPVVGSSIGDTLKTVSGSLGFLKSTVGLGGILLIVFLVVPPLVSVLLHRLALMAASVAAELLGCENEKRLLSGFVTVYGYFLAVLCISAVTFIFLLTLLVRCRLAIGG